MIANKQRSIHTIYGLLLALIAIFVLLGTAQARRQWAQYGDGRYYSFDRRICKDGIEVVLAYVPDLTIPGPATNPVPLIFSTSNKNNPFETKVWFSLTNTPLTFNWQGTNKTATLSGQYKTFWPTNLNPGDKIFYESDALPLAGTIQNGIVENCLITAPHPPDLSSLLIEGSGTGTNKIYVAPNFIIDDINIHLNMPNNPVPENITVLLTSPSNKQITLISQINGATPSAINPIFDQESAYTLTNAAAPFTQTAYMPQGPGKLSDVNGENAHGNWTLTITDKKGGPVQSFDWSLDILGEYIYKAYVPLMIKKPVDAPDLVAHEIKLTTNSIQVTLYNQGSEPIEDTFWVDLYINPDTPPTAVNQTWSTLGTYGAVWGVAGDGLPLNPGEFLTLESGDGYYWPGLSNLPLILLPNTKLFVQVDSANELTDYGAILETHEIMGTPYNNIREFTALATVASMNAQPHQIQPEVNLSTLSPRP